MRQKLKCPFKLEREHSGNASLFFLSIGIKSGKYLLLNIILSSKYQDVVQILKYYYILIREGGDAFSNL